MAFLTWSCGKKAPPRPPVQPDLPLVQDLRAEVTSDGVSLKWTIAAPVKGLAGFNIYRSDPLPQPTDCPACPREYRLIGTVEAKPGDTSFEAIDQSLLGTGLFHYSVVPLDEREQAGPDSNEASLAVGSKQGE
jgi:hypothetical protein